MIGNIPRKNIELNDAIEALDQYYIAASSNVTEAYRMLSSDESEWIDGEIGKCLDLEYYLSNYHCIKTEKGAVKTLYPFWDHQHVLHEAVKKGIEKDGCFRGIVLKPRQSGISTWTASMMFHDTIFSPYTFTMLLAQDDVTAAHIFKMSIDAYWMLPWWLRPEYLYKTKGEYVEFQRESEKVRTVNPGLASAIQVANAQRMTGIAIGRTLKNLHASEASRYPDNDLFTADIKPSMNARDTLSIIESTGFGRNGWFYRMWRGSVRGETDYTPVFIPVYRVRKYSLPTKGEFHLTPEEREVNLRVEREEKFKVTNSFWNWRRRNIRSAIASDGAPWGFYESYPVTPEEAFQSSGICAFDRTSLARQLPNICKPSWAGEIGLVSVLNGEINVKSIHKVPDDEELPPRKTEKELLQHDRLWIWEMPDPNEMYQISGDVALGVIDGDYSVAEVFRVGRGADPDEQVAEWWGHISPEKFADVLMALGFWYKSNGSTASEISVEYQGPGITTGDKLLADDYPSLYRPRHKDRPGMPMLVYFHWVTNIKTRDAIIATMNESLLSNTVTIHSSDLIDEMHDFAQDGTMRFEGQGNNDDGVMASQICLYCLRENSQQFKQTSEPDREQKDKKYDINVYAVYDNLLRQRGQYTDKNIALQMASANPGWCVKPLLICKANTMYSAVHQGNGAEHDLHYRYGMPSTEILPDVVSAYKAANREPVDEQSGDLSDEW
jgi:hypothetical protein